LVVLDHEGSGQENLAPDEVATNLRDRLGRMGWDDRAEAVVIVPELEAWVWSESPVVDEVMGWRGSQPTLREWLRLSALLGPAEVKPRRPKEAMEAALRAKRVQRSSALYRTLAEKVSLGRCEDPSFLRLKEILLRWFPLADAA
jgi:hypothetical protein